MSRKAKAKSIDLMAWFKMVHLKGSGILDLSFDNIHQLQLTLLFLIELPHIPEI